MLLNGTPPRFDEPLAPLGIVLAGTALVAAGAVVAGRSQRSPGPPGPAGRGSSLTTARRAAGSTSTAGRDPSSAAARRRAGSTGPTGDASTARNSVGPRHRWAPRIATALVVAFLAGELTVLVGGFALAAVRTRDTWSPWADAVSDPLARLGAEGRVLRGGVPASARVLRALGGGEQAAGAVRGATGRADVPAGPATADLRTVAPTGGRPGTWAGPWSALPAAPAADRPVLTTVSGRTGAGNRLEAEFGVTTPPGVRPTGRTVYAAVEDDVAWRDVAITGGADVPPGSTAVRLRVVAADAPLVVATPTERVMAPVADALPRGGGTLVDWPLAWLHPCQGQPAVADGIAGPVTETLVFGYGPIGTVFSGTTGGTWSEQAGGQLASQLRSSTLTRRFTVLSTDPGYPMRTVYRLERPFPDRAYDLAVTWTPTPGWLSPS